MRVFQPALADPPRPPQVARATSPKPRMSLPSASSRLSFLPQGWIFNRQLNYRFLNRVRHLILQDRLLAAEINQSLFAVLLVKLLESIKTVPAVSYHLTGLADAAELLGRFQQPQLRFSDLLFNAFIDRHSLLVLQKSRNVRPSLCLLQLRHRQPKRWVEDRLRFSFAI